MKIYDTSGNELTERPDYSLGRLVQDPNDSEKYIYTTWDEVPAGEGYGESGKKSKEEKIANLDERYAADKTALTQEYSDALMHDDTETANDLKAELAALDEWYDAEYQKIEEAE